MNQRKQYERTYSFSDADIVFLFYPVSPDDPIVSARNRHYIIFSPKISRLSPNLKCKLNNVYTYNEPLTLNVSEVITTFEDLSLHKTERAFNNITVFVENVRDLENLHQNMMQAKNAKAGNCFVAIPSRHYPDFLNHSIFTSSECSRFRIIFEESYLQVAQALRKSKFSFFYEGYDHSSYPGISKILGCYPLVNISNLWSKTFPFCLSDYDFLSFFDKIEKLPNECNNFELPAFALESYLP